MNPVFLAAIEDVMREMEAAGFPMFVVCGGRTADEQHEDWLKGRAPDGTVIDKTAIVTECDGFTVKSNHQAHDDGLYYAADLAFVPTKAEGNCFASSWPWAQFGLALESRGMRWGGHFKPPAPVDLDHAEYVPAIPIAG
jgi:hypothetical protein